jgi:hypothetical protein
MINSLSGCDNVGSVREATLKSFPLIAFVLANHSMSLSDGTWSPIVASTISTRASELKISPLSSTASSNPNNPLGLQRAFHTHAPRTELDSDEAILLEASVIDPHRIKMSEE